MRYLRRKLKSSSGVSLLGTLISAVIGIFVVIGVGRLLVNFSEETTKLSKKRVVAEIKTNTLTLLRSKKAWLASVSRNSGRVPGRNTNLILYYNPNPGLTQPNYNASSVQWTCPSSNRNTAIAFFSNTGSLVTGVNCSTCSTQKYCGMDMNSHIAAVITVPTGANNNSSATYPPKFSLTIEDAGGTKTASKQVTTMSDQVGNIFDPQVLTCPGGQVARAIAPDGSLICVQPTIPGGNCGPGKVAVGINTLGNPVCTSGNPINFTCPGNNYLKGFDANGNPLCQLPTIPGGRCAVGQVVTGINTDGTPVCSGVPNHAGGMCPGGAVVNGIYANGTPRCGGMPSPSIRIVGSTRASGGSEPACAHISCPGGYVATSWGAWVTNSDIRRCHIDCVRLGF